MHWGIGVTRVPAGVLHANTLIELIARVPAQHHVAKGQAFIEGGKELFFTQVFAPHDAVNVEQANFDVAQVALADNTLGIVNAVYVLRC